MQQPSVASVDQFTNKLTVFPFACESENYLANSEAL